MRHNIFSTNNPKPIRRIRRLTISLYNVSITMCCICNNQRNIMPQSCMIFRQKVILIAPTFIVWSVRSNVNNFHFIITPFVGR